MFTEEEGIQPQSPSTKTSFYVNGNFISVQYCHKNKKLIIWTDETIIVYADGYPPVSEKRRYY